MLVGVLVGVGLTGVFVAVEGGYATGVLVGVGLRGVFVAVATG